MPNLQKIVKLTQEQYDTLEAGGTVGSYTGLNTNYIYLVQDDNNYVPLLMGDLSSVTLSFLQTNKLYSFLVNYNSNTYTCNFTYSKVDTTRYYAIKAVRYDGYYEYSNTNSPSVLLTDILSGTVGTFHAYGNNQTIKAKNNGTDVTFGANAVVELKAGSNITLTPNSSDNTITIASTGSGTITDVKINNTSIVSSGVANFNTKTAYNASTNKIATESDLPTVNNGTLTIQKNGSNVQTFTANQSGNVTANITVPTKTSDITNDSGFITSHQSIKTLNTNNSSSLSVSSSEAIAGSGTVSLHKVSKTGKLGDLNERTIEKLNEPDSYGNTPTITTMARVDRLRANRFAGGLHPTSIICETSTDAGATWTSAGLSDNYKLKLFSNAGSVIFIPLKNGVKSTDCMARITLSGIEFNDTVKALSETARFAQMTPENWYNNRVYATVSDLYFWLSSNSDRIAINVYASRGNDKDNWVSAGSNPAAAGWSGMNTIHLNNNYSFGGGSTQTGNYWFIRITFRTCANDGSFDDSKLSTSSTTSQQGICNIMGYGANCWGYAHPMGGVDRPYIYDGNNGTYLHEVFRWNGDLVPSTGNTFAFGTTGNQWEIVCGRTLYENGTSLANKYLGKTAKAADADKLDGNDSTYYLNYNNLANKPTIPTKTSELTNDSGFITSSYHDDTKQDVIDDLNAIRSGSALGSTSVQPSEISNMVTTNGTQTITGDKTFTTGIILSGASHNNKILTDTTYGELRINLDNVRYYTINKNGLIPNNSNLSVGTSAYKWKDLYLSGTAYTNNVKTNGTYLALQGVDGALTLGGKAAQFNVPIVPTGTTQSIGASERLWKDLYLSGNLTDGTNSISVSDIASKNDLNFLSLDGGKMDGDIRTGGFGIPEKTILGDGLDIINDSSQAKVTTHYGAGYIQQDDDENTSIRYEYNFPKKNGTIATTSDITLGYEII